jgi:glycerophosphoryl diester phosphodiesterase
MRPDWLVFPILLFIGLAAVTSTAAPSGSAVRAVVNIAHRGGISDGYPENTMAAFRRAMAIGADVIELDLRVTKDGQLVVLHDESLDRTTSGSGLVTDFTLAELKKLDAGGKEPVPTYEEVLQLVAKTGTRLLLDIKNSPLIDKGEIIRLTEKYQAGSNVIFGVRNLDDFVTFHQLNPEILTLGFVTTPFEIEEFADAGVDIIRLWAWWIFLYPDLVERVRQLEKPVWVTAGDASRRDLERLISLGVDGIITDHPEIMVELQSGVEVAAPGANKPP